MGIGMEMKHDTLEFGAKTPLCTPTLVKRRRRRRQKSVCTKLWKILTQPDPTRKSARAARRENFRGILQGNHVKTAGIQPI